MEVLGPREGSRGEAQELRGDAFGHVVAGGDKPAAAAFDGGAFADRPDPGVGRAAVVVDEDAAARPARQTGWFGQVVRGAVAVAKTTRAASSRVRSSRVTAWTRPSGPGSTDRVMVRSGLDAELADEVGEDLSGPGVDLERRRMRGRLDHMGPHAQQPQRVGRFEAEEPAADDDAARPGTAAARMASMPSTDRPVPEAARQVASRDRWDEGREPVARTSAS